ncbi:MULTISPECIES: DUF6124 family protein [unclassified Pseudomonas]|uniref:DUF6124 family protein n=1 Tax=unclassified Pseudomonas TaxID=196821 RepID=UPI000A1DA51D|nr:MULTISPECIES: DUF6124 family protein [unclassified Pseudomonas]
MFKPTPNPPAADSTSPYESTDSRKLHDAAERALDHYLNPTQPSARRPGRMFMVDPAMDDESLLVHASASLASAGTLTSQLAEQLGTAQRDTILAIQQVIMLAGLSVNRVLDNVKVQPGHS